MKPEATEKQSVGDVAKAMVAFYLDHAGLYGGNDSSKEVPGFSNYWAQRKERKFSASWFAVELARAGRGGMPTPPEYHADIIRLRKRIDALPAADRDWTLLYLNGQNGSEILVTEAELIEAAKRRGADALLSVLRGKMPSDDPDLHVRSTSNYWSYERLMKWILSKAPQLLRREMADELIERGRNKSAWVVAAARLQPERGSSILKVALPDAGEPGSEERTTLMAALTEMGDDNDFDLISTWFFNIGARQAGFFNQLPRQNVSKATRQIVARLINDKRFDTAGVWPLSNAATLINSWSLPLPKFDSQKLHN